MRGSKDERRGKSAERRDGTEKGRSLGEKREERREKRRERERERERDKHNQDERVEGSNGSVPEGRWKDATVQPSKNQRQTTDFI